MMFARKCGRVYTVDETQSVDIIVKPPKDLVIVVVSVDILIGLGCLFGFYRGAEVFSKAQVAAVDALGLISKTPIDE